MNKIIISLFAVAALFAFTGEVRADNEVAGTVNQSAAGATGVAQIIVPDAVSKYLNITDMGYLVDAANITSTISIESGKAMKPISTAASGSAKVILVDNASGVFTTTGKCVYFNAAAGSYTYVTATNSTTTGIQFVTAITPAQTVNDKLWALGTPVVKNAVNGAAASSNNGGAFTGCSIWLPGTVPNVLTLSSNAVGNLSISGVRSSFK